jgi:hypothetical protein
MVMMMIVLVLAVLGRAGDDEVVFDQRIGMFGWLYR